jgi:hypothetical protein
MTKELAAAAPCASQQPGEQPLNAGQVNDNTGQQAPTALAAPHQRRHDNQHRVQPNTCHRPPHRL